MYFGWPRSFNPKSIPQAEGFKLRRVSMAHVITDDCQLCGACLPVCPTEAIEEGDPKYTIDPEKCTDCGVCVDECPTGAIVPE